MRLVYPAADIVPQAHVHGVLVAAALHDVEGRDRQYAGEDAGQRLLERGVAVRRPEDAGPAGPPDERSAHRPRPRPRWWRARRARPPRRAPRAPPRGRGTSARDRGRVRAYD